jgi:hypothetical protein
VFRSLINDAKSAAGSVIGKYAIRASVAVPFVIAAGFGTAATTLVLVERFGAVMAYILMAGGFAALGVLAALVVSVKEQEEATEDAQAEKTDTAEVAGDAAAQAAVQLPLALLGTLLTTPMGPGAAAGGARILMRNLPLVLLAAVLAFLFWPSTKTPDVDQTTEPSEDPADLAQDKWQEGNGVDRHAA